MKAKRTFELAVLAIAFAFMEGVCGAQASAERLQQVVQPYVNARVFMGSPNH